MTGVQTCALPSCGVVPEIASRKHIDKIVGLSDILGLIVNKKEEVLDEEVEKLIEERQAARKAKDFAKADEIRDKLADMGIILKDTREGVQWKRA